MPRPAAAVLFLALAACPAEAQRIELIDETKLPAKTSVDYLVIDHIEPPAAN